MWLPRKGGGRRGPQSGSGRLALDRRPDQASPLGPGPVVIAYVRVSEQVLQDEPRVRRALANPAVGDHLLVRRDAFAAVELLQLVRRLEGPVLADRLSPGDVGGCGDMAASLGALLGQVLGCQQLTAVLLGGADVDQLGARVLVAAADVVAEGADLGVGIRGAVLGRLRGRAVGSQLPALGLPFLPTAIHQPDIAMAVILQVPDEPGGEPVVVVAV